MTAPPAHRDQPVLVYDGGCRACSAAVAWLSCRLLVPVLAVPYQSDALDALGLVRAQAERTVWWIGADGRRLHGHRAVAACLLHCHRPWPAIGAVLRSAWLTPFAAAGYRAFARVRRSLPRGRIEPPETLPHLLGEPAARGEPVRPPDPRRVVRRPVRRAAPQGPAAPQRVPE